MAWKRFGCLLNAARQRGRLTQEQLADLLSAVLGAEISQQSVSQWCRGHYRPMDRRTLLGMCRVLQDADGLTSLREINELLEAADQGAVHAREEEVWFPGSAEHSIMNCDPRPMRQECTTISNRLVVLSSVFRHGLRPIERNRAGEGDLPKSPPKETRNPEESVRCPHACGIQLIVAVNRCPNSTLQCTVSHLPDSACGNSDSIIRRITTDR